MTDDFFRSRLDGMIDARHPLAVLGDKLPWSKLEASIAPIFAHQPRPVLETETGFDFAGEFVKSKGGDVGNKGRPRLSLRLMIALTMLKNSFNCSDEDLVQRFADSVTWQYFAGYEYFDSRLPCDATQVGRFRTALGEAGLEEILSATIKAALDIGAVKKANLSVSSLTPLCKKRPYPIQPIAVYWILPDARWCKLPKGLALSSSKPLRRKAKSFAGALGAMPMPSSSSVLDAPSNAKRRSLEFCSERYKESCL